MLSKITKLGWKDRHDVGEARARWTQEDKLEFLRKIGNCDGKPEPMRINEPGGAFLGFQPWSDGWLAE